MDHSSKTIKVQFTRTGCAQRSERSLKVGIGKQDSREYKLLQKSETYEIQQCTTMNEQCKSLVNRARCPMYSMLAKKQMNQLWHPLYSQLFTKRKTLKEIFKLQENKKINKKGRLVSSALSSAIASYLQSTGSFG